MKPEVLAILTGDWHCWLTPPAARVGEKHWLDAMVRPIYKIGRLQERHCCPVLIAGDIFDRYNPPPELIWKVIKAFPANNGREAVYAVPGQHDLHLHNLEDIWQTAYGLLASIGRLNDLSWVNRRAFLQSSSAFRFEVHGFGWGQKITPPQPSDNLKVCLVHKFLFSGSATGFPGAPEDGLIYANDQFRGYDVIVSGDNHQSFYKRTKNKFGQMQSYYNAGSLHRRNSDQADHRPQVGLLMSDGSVKVHYLDISKDVFTPTEKAEEIPTSLELEAFIEELRDLKSQTIDFGEAVDRAILKLNPSKGVREILAKARMQP